MWAVDGPPDVAEEPQGVYEIAHYWSFWSGRRTENECSHSSVEAAASGATITYDDDVTSTSPGTLLAAMATNLAGWAFNVSRMACLPSPLLVSARRTPYSAIFTGRPRPSLPSARACR
jgi:hypothetical protein